MITERAMLAAVHISIWTAVKHDRKVSRDVADRHGAHQGAGRYNKQLLRGADKLDELRTLAGQILQYFYKITLPWSDEGFRLLPSNFYFDLMAQMREFESGFEQGVESFLRVYPQYIEQVKPELNGLFREEDYPAAEKLRTKFGVKLEILPIPSGADFRVQMSAEEQARVAREIDTNVRESLMRGTEDLWRRLSSSSSASDAWMGAAVTSAMVGKASASEIWLKRIGAFSSAPDCCSRSVAAEISLWACSSFWRHCGSCRITTFSTTRSTIFTIGSGSFLPQRRQFARSLHWTSSEPRQRTFSRSSLIVSPLKLKRAGSIEETELHIGFCGRRPKRALLPLSCGWIRLQQADAEWRWGRLRGSHDGQIKDRSGFLFRFWLRSGPAPSRVHCPAPAI
jgi:hypothetical protein